MDRLSATDAAFVYAETPRAPMHVAALQFYDPATAPSGAVSVGQIVENVRRRAHLIDCYHRKLLETPWQLDHPQWINDGDFDPARHVFSLTLPAPGGWRRLCEAVARLDAQLLDRRLPLWEMHVITGLGDIPGIPSDAFAIFTKIHHAAVDGVAGIGVTLALHDLQPVGTPPEPSDLPAEAAPTAMELIQRAVFKEALRPMRLFNAWPALTRVASAWPEAPATAVTPSTRFNRPVSNGRVFDAIRLPLAELQACKRLVDGATINDVVLTIIGGAMRRYLQAHGELPRRPLTTLVPTSTRKQISQPSEGNQIAQLIVGLGTDIADPRDRLGTVQKNTARAKAAVNRLDAASLDTVSALQPASWVAYAASGGGQVFGSRAYNTVVTNVKGPPVALYTCGAKLLAAFGTGPLADGLGIFHTALSYCGELTLSVLACADLVADLEMYIGCLRTEYEELRTIAAGVGQDVANDPQLMTDRS